MNEQIEAIRNEIKRLEEIHERNLKKPMERGRIGYAHGVVACCDRILSFIDSLPEEPNKSLEEAAEKFAHLYDNGTCDGIAQDCFIAGAKWQEEQDLAEMVQTESSLSVAYANRCFENGKQAMKEQMLKYAVEGEVIKTDKHTSVRYKSFYGTDRYFYGIADKQFKPGEKVRIIIVKEDEL